MAMSNTHAFSKDLYGELVEVCEDAIITIDERQRICLFNRSAQRVFGYKAEEVLGEPMEMLMPEHFAQVHSRHFNGFAASRTRSKFMSDRPRISGRRKDGSEFPAEITISKVEAGGRLYIAAVLRDVTERQQAEEALKLLERDHRELYETVPVAYLTVGADGCITSSNSAAQKLTGYTKAELRDLLAQDLQAEESDEGAVMPFQNLLDGTPCVNQETSIRRKNGETMPVLLSVTAAMDDKGKLLEVRGVIIDITDRKRAEETLKQQAETLARVNQEVQQFAWMASRTAEELQDFAHVASHDLQEPLRMVTSYTQLLASRYADKLDEDAREFITFAVDGATRMQELIQELLAYSRAGGDVAMPEEVDCETILDRSLANLRASIEENDAIITRDPLPKVMGDETQLTQVFQNLIGNAIKYRRDRRPELHVSAQQEADRWRLSIRDNGIGMDPKHTERIFKVFQRLHGKGGKYPGTGIGLAICKKIIEQHYGRIWAESTPGQGSTFHFTLSAVGGHGK